MISASWANPWDKGGCSQGHGEVDEDTASEKSPAGGQLLVLSLSTWEPILFLTNLVARIECPLSWFADRTALCGSGSFTGGQVVIQKDIDKLQKESSRNLTRFSTGECRVLALIWEAILLPSRLGINWLKSSFVKKDLRAPVDNRGNMSQR